MIDVKLCRDLITTLRVHDGRMPGGPWRWEGGGRILLPDAHVIVVDALPRIRDVVTAGIVGMRNDLMDVLRQLEIAAGRAGAP